MAKISDSALTELTGALSGVTSSAALQAIRAEWACRHGCSLQTAYYHTHAGRKRRCDAGQSKILCDTDAFKDAVAITAQTDAAAPLAMHMAGLGGMSHSTFRRRLRSVKLSRRHLKNDNRVYRRFEATHSNALHQIDATRSVLYFNWKGGRIRWLPIPTYKNKPGDDKEMLHILALVDDHSRCRYARYYSADTSANWVDFLFRCWRRKSNNPFFGVPDAIYCDNASVYKSGYFKRVFAPEYLNVEIKHSLPYYKQSRGKIERTIGIIEQDFEKVIQIRSPEGCPDINALNDLLEDYLIWRNGQRHSETGQIPYDRWRQGINLAGFRDLPDEQILRCLKMERFRMTINAYCEIQMGDGKGNKHYYNLSKLPEAAEFVNEKVEICIHPGDWSKAVVTLGDNDYEVTESGRLVNALGEFECAANSEQQSERLEAVTRKVISDRSWERPAAADTAWIAPAEKPIESVMFERPSPFMSRYDGQDEAARLIKERAGRSMTSEENRAFLNRFIEQVTAEEVNKWVEEILQLEEEEVTNADGAAIAG